MLKVEQVLAKIASIQAKGLKLSLTYRKRANVFVNYKSSCTFNPETGLGHSYGWYELTKVIRGQLVLNSYCYSIQTIKHVGKIRRLFDALGLDYIELEAPKGLQDLTEAMEHAVSERATYLLKARFARREDTKASYLETAEGYAKDIATLRSMGVSRVDEKAIAKQVETARSEKLASSQRLAA